MESFDMVKFQFGDGAGSGRPFYPNLEHVGIKVIPAHLKTAPYGQVPARRVAYCSKFSSHVSALGSGNG